jgi:plastocyanin
MNAKFFPMLRVLTVVGSLWASPFGVAQTPPATGHEGHDAHPAPPANDAPPKAEDFLSLSADGKKVRIVLISAFNGVNYGMNFNGFAKGQAKFVLPVGADVEVAFTNRSPVPHSVVVVERPQVKRLQMGEPSFAGATTPNAVRGTTGTKGETFSFKATEAGDYAFACGFPSHAANGHWITLEVSDKATLPSLQLGTGPVFTPAAK